MSWAPDERSPRHTQAREHLAILDAIERLDYLRAATLMRDHLEGARRGKVGEKRVFEAEKA